MGAGGTLDTIAALATPTGRGALGLLRVSGADAMAVAGRLLSGAPPGSRPSHTARLHRLVHPVTGNTIDDVVATVFHAPRSYTGEDTVEIAFHGGLVTATAALDAAAAAGARPAEAGEFTRRALIHGRLDLRQAEAVAAQIDARTESARRLAVAQRLGVAGQALTELRRRLIDLLAAVEASIDFPDEVDEPDRSVLASDVSDLASRLGDILETARRGLAVTQGLRVAIVGRPNVGKSSLLNALVGRNRAIVSPHPGTTRDTVEAVLEIDGIPVTLVDTAGVRDTADPVERIGVERARDAAAEADAILLVVDAAEGWTPDDAAVAAALGPAAVTVILNKTDVARNAVAASAMSCVRGLGFSAVMCAAAVPAGAAEVLDFMKMLIPSEPAAEACVLTNVRQRDCALRGHAAALRAVAQLARGAPWDMVAADIASSADALGELSGDNVSDDVLRAVFSAFCIGK